MNIDRTMVNVLAFMVFNKQTSRGVLKVGQEIEIRPGLVSKDSEGLIHIPLLLLHFTWSSKVFVNLFTASPRLTPPSPSRQTDLPANLQSNCLPVCGAK